MNGAEHFQTAEQLLAYVDQSEGVSGPPTDLIAQAQVHATLAQAAAVVEAAAAGVHFPETNAARQWREVLNP